MDEPQPDPLASQSDAEVQAALHAVIECLTPAACRALWGVVWWWTYPQRQQAGEQ
jgi:hypothetical protein